KLWAAEAFVDQVSREADAVLHDAREILTEQARGDLAVRIAAAKLRAADVSLEISNKIFELTGARATSNDVGLDIYWRNIRTHTLHDPLAYKRREVGSRFLTGEIPEPTWYT
ncbi:monooxygenase, partial [Rhodococcus enclensis]|nr:monooxygenase [Rhodococcus qingshengii]